MLYCFADDFQKPHNCAIVDCIIKKFLIGHNAVMPVRRFLTEYRYHQDRREDHVLSWYGFVRSIDDSIAENGGFYAGFQIDRGDEIDMATKQFFEIFGEVKEGVIGVVFGFERVEYVIIRGFSVFTSADGSEDADCFYAEMFLYLREVFFEFCKNVLFDAGIGRHDDAICFFRY